MFEATEGVFVNYRFVNFVFPVLIGAVMSFGCGEVLCPTAGDVVVDGICVTPDGGVVCPTAGDVVVDGICVTPDGEVGNPPVEAAVVTLSYASVKVFRFDWADVADATHYKLLEDADGSGVFVQAGSDVAAGGQALEHAVPLYARLNAQYVLQSCNAGGCTDSAPVVVAGTLSESIGNFKASNTDADDRFGESVSLSADGDTLAVGAFFEDSAAMGIGGNQGDESAIDAGAVYVFVRSGGNWSQQAYVKASNTGANDFFGRSLSLSADGDTLAVGATGESSGATGIGNTNPNDNSISNAGAVYVFVRSGGSWSQQAYVKSNTGAGDRFGVSLSLSADGDALAVGAFFEDSAATGIGGNEDDESITFAGAVYVFVRSGGSWSQQAYVKASNTGAGDQFGGSVSLSADGDTLAVGAHGEDSNATGIGNTDPNDNSAIDAGAVYVFVRSGRSWSQQAYVKASNTGAGDQFGVSLSLSADGDTLAVGATSEDSGNTNPNDNSAGNAGAVYVFVRSGGSWSQQAYVKASNTDAGDRFGESVSLSADGDTLAVGARLEDSGAMGIGGNQGDESANAAGAVYVFVRSGGNWSQQAYVKASNTGANDFFGGSLSLSADGDTLAVGARDEESGATGVGNTNPNDNSISNAGAVYLY